MSRSLPPLNALRAFEATARHLSFKKAAHELNVTPAALSHQVKALEDLLGVQLFHRMTRALRLTNAGKAALPSLTTGFDALLDGVTRLRQIEDSGPLIVSVNPGFGSLWLVPRLEAFRRAYPDIEIRIDGTDRLADVVAGEADVAIRYGSGGYGGVQVDQLFSQRNTPVCSPALLAGENPLLSPDDLRHHTLLHVSWKDEEASWRNWLRALGFDHIHPTRGPHFTQEEMAVQAALDGQGVALVGDRLVQDHLAAGRLVRPFGDELTTPLSFAYYILTARDAGQRANVVAFRKWLLEEALARQSDVSPAETES